LPALPWRGGLTMTRGLKADAGKRTRSAHRAIEIREKRRRALSFEFCLNYLISILTGRLPAG
jgi:hypothetical protein